MKATTKKSTAVPSPAASGRAIAVRASGVHGKGVFALRTIKKGERIIEYKGEVIDWPEAMRRHPHDPEQPNHTFYFTLDDEHVIDGNAKGNSSRWINHSCNPNCESETVESSSGRTRVFIGALRTIKPGEELFFDYSLVIDEPHTKKIRQEYACMCGSRNCRGTMLEQKRKRS